MSYVFGGVQWNPVTIEHEHRYSTREGGTITIHTSPHKNTGKLMVKNVSISADLVQEAGFKVGDKVRLFSNGGSLFMIKKENSSLTSTLKKCGGGNKLYINEIDFARTLHAKTQCYKFDAWYDDGAKAILFKPRPEEKTA